LIRPFQSIADFSFSIAITIAIKNPIRINHDLMFIFQSDRDFSNKIGSRFLCSNRIAIEKPGPETRIPS
jgi:hypothetical protein